MLWDALTGVAAYAVAMWPLWVPVVAAVAASAMLRSRGRAAAAARVTPFAGAAWLAAVAVFLT